MAAWWEKNKKYVFYAVWAVVGLFGGNADRLAGLLPDVEPCKCEKPTDVEPEPEPSPYGRDYSK